MTLDVGEQHPVEDSPPSTAPARRRMAYERVAAAVTPGRHPRRTRIIVAVVVLASIGLGFALGRSSPPKRPVDVAAARAAEAVVTQADNLVANLGAPAPVGSDPATWPIRPAATTHASGALRLAGPTWAWVVNGQPKPLTSAQARATIDAQGALVRRLFAPALARDYSGQLRDLVAKELRPSPVPSAPGGTRVLQWFAPSVTGDTARVEGQVEEWTGQYGLVPQNDGTVRLEQSVTTGELDVTARLVKRQGVWRITELDQAPYQQAT